MYRMALSAVLTVQCTPTRAIPERLRGVFTTKRCTNPLPYLWYYVFPGVCVFLSRANLRTNY